MAPEDMQVVVDVPDLLARLQNDRELLVELSEILKTEYPTHLRSLEQAVSGEDMKTVERTGHALKGMFAALSAARAAVMPELLGPDVCRHVRQRRDQPYVYMVLLTSKESKQDVVAGLEPGADDYLIKSFDPDELEARLRTGARVVL